jgi:hypothetical protein
MFLVGRNHIVVQWHNPVHHGVHGVHGEKRMGKSFNAGIRLTPLLVAVLCAFDSSPGDFSVYSVTQW